jgi:hypothetical protein
MARSRIEILLMGAAAVVTACGSEGAGSKARNEDDASSGGGNAAGGASTGGSTAGGGRIDSGGQTTGSGGRQQAGGANATGGKSSGGSSNGGSVAGGGTAGAGGSPPGADAGPSDVISGRHPGDVGIGADPDVVFADDFEGYSKGADLNQRWSAVYQNQYVGITTESANVYAGKKALEFTLPQQDQELSDATDKVLTTELDALYLRYYSKFEPPYDVVGSSHNGSSISAHYFQNGNATPGVPADGTNKFLVNLENWRGEATTPSPGPLNVYVYHPGQRSQYGDHFFPTGQVLPYSATAFDFGPSFVKRPDVTPELGRWYCYEYLVQANTPGKKDGRITVWLDDALTADFPNLTFRDVASLKIDRFGLSFHIGSNPNGQSRKWYDNVVAAKARIGCLVQ